jgi:hypothetical protein
MVFTFLIMEKAFPDPLVYSCCWWMLLPAKKGDFEFDDDKRSPVQVKSTFLFSCRSAPSSGQT